MSRSLQGGTGIRLQLRITSSDFPFHFNSYYFVPVINYLRNIGLCASLIDVPFKYCAHLKMK